MGNTLMELKYESDWGKLFDRLNKLEANVKSVGESICQDAVQNMDDLCRDHLASQGRGGATPPLTAMTKHIYSIDGEPDGSGIRNHMEVKTGWAGNEYTAVLGILDGKPTIVAKVQNDGCIIDITPAMRGYFAARYGIFFKADKKYLVVPGRRFWDESWEKTRSETIKELSSFFRNVLG
jgi:hypothetical protein